jgi:hypothetical protein
MIDIATEHHIPLNETPERVPSRPHVSTCWRWARRGVRGHKLETIVIGGRRYTSREALERFFTALNQPQPTTKSGSDQQREQQLAQIDQRLTEMGID